MSKFTKGKITLYIFLTAIVTSSYGQGLLQQPIQFKKGTYSLKQALRIVESPDFVIAYSSDLLPDVQLIFHQDPATLGAFLEVLTATAGIRYSITGDFVAITYMKPVFSDRKSSIRGIVRDEETGEVLIGANVYSAHSNKGTVTNKYGYYSLTLKEGIHILEASFLGYKIQSDTITLGRKNRYINFNLSSKTKELDEITISSIEPNVNITSLIPGVNTLDMNTKGQIPYFLGEVDVLQGAALLPGISTLGEDANGLNIRGGRVDQNLILLDEATVYNPNHLYGLISIFNPEAINSIEIMKGFIPPSYGGRASSVIMVQQKEGNDQEYKFTGGLGLVSAKFIAEGPIRKNESSFIVSGRQSLLNLSLDQNNTRSNFQDLNIKLNWKAHRSNTFYLAGYFGNDRNVNNFDRVINWGNRNLSARWNHLFGPRIFTNLSLILSEYNYKVSQPQEAASYIGQSNIVNYTLKSDWGLFLSPAHEVDFGGNLIFHRLKPGDRIPFEENTSSSKPLIIDSEHGLESALYLSHQVRISKKLSALYGFRLSSLHNYGPGNVYQYDPDQTKSLESVTDTLTYDKWDIIKPYYGLEPRASVNLQLTETSSFKASYTKTYQYLHLISSTITPSPTDIWKLSDTHIAPSSSIHYSIGYFQNFRKNMWEMYIEAYYKQLDDIVEYKDGADLLYNENPETELLKGRGHSYGMEFFLKKNRGKLTGWISYTLSKTEIRAGKFPEEAINEGNFFPANHDRRHDLSVVGIYEFLPRLSGSLGFNYNSGRPFTLPTGRYDFEGNPVPHFEERNQSRLPAYHRLDLSIKWQGRALRKNGEARKISDYWTFVIYNLYGRNNVYSYLFTEGANDGVNEIVPYTIFDSPIPAITYHFKF